jgi:hypothetical protein
MTRRGLILNSQQHLYPHGGQSWIQQTVTAVKWLKSQDCRLILTTGAPTWELLEFLAQEEKLPVDLYPQNESETVVQLHERMLRDAAIILPVSIRPGGKLASLLSSHSDREKTDHRFSVQYEKEIPRENRYQFEKGTPLLPFQPDQYLYHWTRTARTGWPDQNRDDYFRKIIGSDSFPFTAMHTLDRILESRLVLASSRHMRKNSSVVSFTELTPVEMLSRMNWRKRYREMSFEPYGIGILKSWAASQGVREVQYTEGNASKKVNDAEEWLLQGAGRNHEWSPEREYRAQGDLRLPSESPDLVAMTYHAQEAHEISNRYGILCGSFCDEPLI